MRISEIICEDILDEIIEDEANDPVIMYLIELLDGIRERSHNLHQIPKVRADALINLVQLKHPQFNLDILEMSKSSNNTVKGLIKDIKDDATGIKYVYITPFADEVKDAEAEIGDENAPRTAPEKTVNSMAKSALAKRS